MLSDAGAALTIVGHRECRDAQRESDAEVRAKAEAALSCGLGVILCVGESSEIREAGQAVETVAAQLDASLPRQVDEQAATGRRLRADLGDRHRQGPDPAEIGEMHAALRKRLLAAFGDAGDASASSTAGRSKPRMPLKSSRLPTSTARWSAARA